MSAGQRGSGVANNKPMKKLLTITLILFSTLLFSQGTLTENGVTIATIPQYDLSNGNTSWVLNINKLYSYKWLMFFQFEILLAHSMAHYQFMLVATTVSLGLNIQVSFLKQSTPTSQCPSMIPIPSTTKSKLCLL